MALRSLMLGKKLSDKNKELTALREKLASFDERKGARGIYRGSSDGRGKKCSRGGCYYF